MSTTTHQDTSITNDEDPTVEDVLREFTSPETGDTDALDAAAFHIAYDALWRVKMALKAMELTGDIGNFLRLIGDNTLDLAYDWAEQYEDGATNYS